MMSQTTKYIDAGTQVVVLTDILGANNALIHPRGVVGIVTRTPTRNEQQYLIRFPDGHEASLYLHELNILKHFKDYLPGNDFASVHFNLENLVIYRCVVGSRAYGLENEESDTDYRGVYLAPPQLQWSLYGAPDQFEDNASQSCYWELQKFLLMALKANPNILECLYSPVVEKISPLGEELLSLRQKFLSTHL